MKNCCEEYLLLKESRKKKRKRKNKMYGEKGYEIVVEEDEKLCL